LLEAEVPDPCRELHDLLFSSEVDQASKMDRIAALPDIDPCIERGLEAATAQRDWDRFQYYVYAAYARPSATYASALIEALKLRDRAVPIEDVLEVLAQIGDPSTLPVVEETYAWSLEWDEFYGVALKCVWVVEAIDTADAGEFLERIR
jgi:hypothetical protein